MWVWYNYVYILSHHVKTPKIHVVGDWGKLKQTQPNLLFQRAWTINSVNRYSDCLGYSYRCSAKTIIIYYSRIYCTYLPVRKSTRLNRQRRSKTGFWIFLIMRPNFCSTLKSVLPGAAAHSAATARETPGKRPHLAIKLDLGPFTCIAHNTRDIRLNVPSTKGRSNNG